MGSVTQLIVVVVLGVAAGAALAVNLYLLARGEDRMLRDEQQLCQVERQIGRLTRWSPRPRT